MSALPPTSSLQRMRTPALVFTLLGLIFVLVALYLKILTNAPSLTDHAFRADYIVFLSGGTMFAQGHHSATDLYNIALQTATQQHILAGGVVSFADSLVPFVHPPYVAILSTPLAYFSPAVGFIVWDAVQFLLLLLSLYLLRPLLPLGQRYLLWLGAFAWMPIYQDLIYGQISPLLLLSVVLMWRNLRTGGKANWWAGISLALGLIKPQLLLLFLLYLLYKRNWRALAGFTISATAVYLVTAIVSGFDWPFVYLNILNWINSQPNRYSMHPDRMYTWRGLLVRFNLNDPLILGTLIVITIAMLVYAWWRSDRRMADQSDAGVTNLDLQLAATTIATVLTSIYLYTHDLTILLFSGVVLLGWAAQRGWPGWISAVLLLNLFAAFTIFFGQPTDALFVAAIAIAFAELIYLLIQPQPVPKLAREPAA